jgi:DNA-binding NarL/FixJ family response regulator
MKRITVLLADDHTIVREGIRKMVEMEADFEVVGEARDGRQAVDMVLQLAPDVVLMDIAMPVVNGLEATRQLHKARPATKVIVLTAHGDDGYVSGAIEAGAVGFLNKQSSAKDVCKAIREAHKGNVYFCPEVAKRLNRLFSKQTEAGGSCKRKAHPLSSREMEVLQMVAEGYANKQMASELGISIKTVEKHRGSLMAKLDVHDTAGLTRYAIGAGIIESGVQVTIV